MAQNPTHALTRLSPEDSQGIFDIYIVGFPPDGKPRKPESASSEAGSKDPTFDTIGQQDWTQIVPQLIPEAEVFEFVPFQEREDLQGQASEETEAAAPSQQRRKNFIRSAADLDTEARLLLDCIKNGPKKRRVLLAGCGLGGLVIKQAIVIANRNPRYYDAASLIEQLVFVATPHIAPNLDVWEDIAGRSLDAAEVIIRGRKTQILTGLATSIQRSSFIFHCFASRYDVKNLPYGATAKQDDLVDGSSESDISSFLLYADEVQSQLNKSGKISEYDLRDYLSTPKLLNLDSVGDANHIPESVFESQFIDFLQQLAPSSWIFHENSAIQLLEPDVELQLYEQHLSELQLLKTFGEGAVNITGPPGYGKTTLLKLLIQRLKQQHSRAITIDVFLESFEASSRTSNQILRSVIHQILSQRPSLFQNIRLLHTQQKKIGTWTDEILWDIFQRLIRHSGGWRIIVSINNFKHWSLESRSVFTKLDKILATSSFRYIMLTTGRGDNSGLSHEPDEVIDLTTGAEDSGKRFIKAKLDILLRKKPALAPCEKDILETASIWEGSYSHTERCLKQLSSNFTLSSPDAIAVAVETCPKSEDDISRDRIKALLHEDSHVLNWSINVVSWVMHSARPLRIQELAVAAALHMGVGDNPLANVDRHISRSMEHDLDQYLDVLIRADSQVAHIYSAATKKFLAEKLPSHFHEGDGSLKGFRLLNHAKLAILCIKYISRAISENWEMCRARLDWRSNKFQADQSKLEFLSYAVRYWPIHYHRHYDQARDNPSAEEQEEDNSTKLEDVIIEFFNNEDMSLKWYQLFSLKTQSTDVPNQQEEEEVANEEITPLEIVSELGLTAVAKRILTSDKDVLKSSPNILSSALALSVRYNYSDITAILLEMNAPVSSAFIEAACTNNVQAMRSLMAHGAKLKDEDHLGSLALRKAASTESLDAVKLLLGENVDVSEADTDGRSAIHAVAIGGVVEMLQNISNLPGFDINARDNEQQTALILAVQFDHVKLVRELCLKNADVTLADSQGKTALQYAVSKDLDITKALIENKASAVIGDKEGQTALDLACRLGCVEAVEVMLNSLDNASLLNLVHVDQAAKISPLHIAAKFGYTAIVKLLLSKGVNVRLEDSSGNTAIQLSASAGHLDVLRILLEHHLSHRGDFVPEDLGPVGEDTNNQNEEEFDKDLYKITAVKECNELLCRAVASGQLIVVRYLLNYMDSSHPSIPVQTSTLGDNLLNIAASKGYTEIVRALLPRFDPNVKNAENRTPLDLAVSGKHRGVIRLLLESGADPNVSDSDRQTPLHIAARSGLYEIFEDLLRSGGDVYARTILKETALHLAVEFPNIVRLLIAASADLNAKDYNEATPLHLAVRADSIPTIKLLLQAGADLDAVDEDDETPLHYAIARKNPKTVRELWKFGPKLTGRPYRLLPPLIQASEDKSFDIVRIILGETLLTDSTNNIPDHGNAGAQRNLEDMTLLNVNAETSDSRTPLLVAVAEQQLDIVKALLKLDADLTSRDGSGRTPLLEAVNLGNAEIFDALLEKGADIDSKDNDGSTALHLVLNADNLTFTERLIGLFNDKSMLDVQDASGSTPLHRAAFHGRKAAVELLLQAKANPNIQSKTRRLPIHEGCDDYKITLVLADAGSKLNTTDHKGWTPLMQCVYWEHLDVIELLLERDKNVNHVDKSGRTLLHIAVDCYNTDGLRRCLKLGSIDIDKKDNGGRTALHTAASIWRNSSFEAMTILVEHEAAVETIDKEGHTPLWTAIESSVLEKCSLLTSKGAKVNQKNSKGQTSERRERIWTVDELLEALSHCRRANLLLDEIDMATWNPKQAFTALRSCFEINFIDRILSARDFLESASQVTDDDMWTLRHFRYHMAEAYSRHEESLVSEKPKGETLIDTDRWEVTKLSVTSKTTDNITQTFRANHPFPIRGEPHAYFEAEASAPESQEGPVNFAIGLCGEFVDFGSSLPGTKFHPSIGFHSDDGRIFISAIGDQTQQPASQKIGPFAQSVKIGCGIDWNEKMIFFTRNGEVVGEFKCLTMKKTILIIGGTGAQGVPVVKESEALTSDSKYKLRIVTRNTSSKDAQYLAAIPGVTIHEGNAYDEPTLRQALNGVNGIFVNTNGLAIGEKAEVYWGIRLYELSREFGLEHFVYSSVEYSSKLGNFQSKYRCFLDAKGKVADYISAQPTTPMAWSVLTACTYMESLTELLRPTPDPSDPATLVFAAPLGSAKFPLMHLEDYGKYVRWAFDTPARSNGLNLHIGTEDVNWGDLAATFTELTGKRAVYKDFTLDEYFNRGTVPDPERKVGHSADPNDPTLLTYRQSYGGFWNCWKDELSKRDYDLLDDILPTRVKSVREWMKKTGYTGEAKSVLKDYRDRTVTLFNGVVMANSIVAKLGLAGFSNELTVTAANLNFDFTLIKVEAPKEYSEVNNSLTEVRRENAENGPLHRTARKLGALFDGIPPPAEHLLAAYGNRVSEICQKAKINPQDRKRHGIFARYSGTDSSSLWAAATSGTNAIAIHLLACMLAEAFTGPESVSLWFELIERRKAEIGNTLETTGSVDMAKSLACKQEFSRSELGVWDNSARSWVQTANKTTKEQRSKALHYTDTTGLAVNKNSDPYHSVMTAWKDAMSSMDSLIMGVPQKSFGGLRDQPKSEDFTAHGRDRQEIFVARANFYGGRGPVFR
ncbi:hypothetical protein THAR02_06340 [Trichoderma harzianum]|uniref:B30.2/SPRY domain-containing protein n=1 Tax=Trichoderma harzianum TaxID=5544 RepID=A0A0F9XAQ2_TRIHA|nr:hypothetical protein THAR02_06340 [Trichoderma harzianum]